MGTASFLQNPKWQWRLVVWRNKLTILIIEILNKDAEIATSKRTETEQNKNYLTELK